MKDMIVAGTGDSRFLKSSVPAGTTWNSVLAMLRAGTFPVDFNGLNPSGITQTGSAYNKANVLPQDVCDLLGLDETLAEPKDAFEALFNGAASYVWEKCTQVPQSVTKSDTIENFSLAIASNSSYSYPWFYADDITVDASGNVSLSGTVTQLNVSNSLSLAQTNVMVGKYAYPKSGTPSSNQSWPDYYCVSDDGASVASKIVYFPPDATSVSAYTTSMVKGGTLHNGSYNRILPAQAVMGQPTHLETVGFVVSGDITDYPDGGWSGGYYYKLVKNGVQTFYSYPLYIWREHPELYTFQNVDSARLVYGNSTVYLLYGTEIEIVDGRATIKSPTEISIAQNSTQDDLSVLRGKYIQYLRANSSSTYFYVTTSENRYSGNTYDVFYIPPDATFSISSSNITASAAQVVKKVVGGVTNYICSFDYNHYPHNAYADGRYYEYMGELSELLHNNDELVNIILGVTST